MDMIEDYNNWLKKISTISVEDITVRIYSLHDKSISSQNSIVDDDDPAFIFVFKSDNINTFNLMLPLSVLQKSSEFIKYSTGELDFFTESTMNNFPHGKIWSLMDEEIIEQVENYIDGIRQILKISADYLDEEIKDISDF